ncbi:MAG: PAS domain S-box protein [Thermoflexales bacterium]|nr:PAS domain S-box protein [Thermoflexales bacterium]
MQYILFVALAPTGALISLVVAGYAFRQRDVPGASALGLYMLAVSGFLIGNTLELMWPTEAGTLFWAKLDYLFIVTIPLAWLAFAFQYTGKTSWLSPRNFWPLMVIPVVTFVLAQTNSRHHLLWSADTFQPVGDMLSLHVSHGPWFWVHILYSYLLLFAGAGLIIGAQIFASSSYHQQSVWAIAGALSPLLLNIAYVFQLVPGLRKDYTPLAFALAGIAFAVAIFRYRLLDLIPVARATVVERMRDGVVVVDSEGRLVDFNPAARQMLGVSEEAIGQPMTSVLREYPGLAQIPPEGRVHRRIGGDEHVLEVRSSPLTNGHRGSGGRLILLRDITEQVRTEESLQQANRDLQARTEELDAFGHTVAHDLRNPLAIIRGFAELLDDETAVLSEEERHTSIQSILRVADRMERIVEEMMLLFGLSRAGVQMQPLDMIAIVAAVVDRMALALRDSGAEVVVPSAWPVALGYPSWVEEVWANYISNAVKYGGHPPRVELGATAEGDRVRFWVRDNGPGLTAEQQSRLFQPFERLGTQRATGHGLGLSIVRRIVEKMGGEVGVESSGVPGEGCTFSFTLPLAPVA